MRHDAGVTSVDFWTLIREHGGEPEPLRTRSLVDRLAAGDPARIAAFADELARAVHALDTPQHAAQEVRDATDPPGMPAVPLSARGFLRARLAVVAAGEERWRQVLADPGALSGTWSLNEADALSAVAPQAWERATGRDWDHETPVSMESGTNSAAWGDRANLLQLPRRRWLARSARHADGAPANPVYESAAAVVTQVIGEDETWTAWWAGAAVPELVLAPLHTPAPARRPQLRRGRDAVRLECTLDGRRPQTVDRAELADRATADLLWMLELVQQRLALPELPELPALPPVPDSVPDAYTGPPDDQEEIVRSMVALLGLSQEQARAMVTGGGPLPR
jgi:hypothetical protein